METPQHPITIYASLFSPKTDRDFSQRAILRLLDGLVDINMEYLKRYPTPALYASGVVYQRENGTENWLAIPDIIERGGGDCEDLACWRVAELRLAGYRVRPFLRWRKIGDGFYLYHVLVRREDGSMEDPSRRLGMGKED